MHHTDYINVNKQIIYTTFSKKMMKSQVTKLFSTPCPSRQLHLSAINEFRKISREKPDVAKLIENEKRGVFRVLDIGKPKPVKLSRAPQIFRSMKMPAPPR